MSHDTSTQIVPSIIANGEPSVSRSPGQRQQWKLALEKAYLELSQSGYDTAKDDKGTVSFHGDSIDGENEVNPRVPGDAELVSANSSDQGMPVPGDGYPGSDLNLDANTINRLGRTISAAFQNSGNPLFVNLRTGQNVHGAKVTMAPTPASGNPVREGDGNYDKAVYLYLAEEGIQLAVTHRGTLTAGQIQKIILTVRDMLKSQGLRLAKVIVNGSEFWRDEGLRLKQAAEDIGNRLNEIDKVY